MKLESTVIFFLITASAVTAETFVYEFGNDDGQVIYNKDGTIPLLNWSTDVDIPVPFGMVASYVKVTVNALSAPKVDYDALYHRVTIKYSWTQVTLSSYNVLVKARRYDE